MSAFKFSGGAKLAEKLKELAALANKDALVKVGFFEGATETKSGVSTAYVAACNEFGGQSNPEDKDSEPNPPPRPFFRGMIKDGQNHWGEDMAKALERYSGDVDLAMEFMGQQLGEELQNSIQKRRYAPLSPKTIARKKNDQTLIDTGDMSNAVSFQVNDGEIVPVKDQ
jgi:hypothetical protein